MTNINNLLQDLERLKTSIDTFLDNLLDYELEHLSYSNLAYLKEEEEVAPSFGNPSKLKRHLQKIEKQRQRQFIKDAEKLAKQPPSKVKNDDDISKRKKAQTIEERFLRVLEEGL